MSDDPPEKPDRGFRPRINYIKPEGSKGSGLVVTPEGIFSYEAGRMETLADAVDYFWATVAANPREWNANLRGYDWLIEHAAEATREDLRRTLGWLEGAIALKDRTAAVAACKYLAAMPSLLLAA